MDGPAIVRQAGRPDALQTQMVEPERDHGARALGAVAAAPIGLSQPVAQLADQAAVLDAPAAELDRAARLLAAVQVAAVLVGWGLAQYPYLIVPDVTLTAAATAPHALRVVLWVLGGGTVLLLPTLAYLFRTASKPAWNREVVSGE